MFCQQCGAELRQESGFCSVCGAGAPAPRLHVDQKTGDQPGKRRTVQAETPPAAGARPPSFSLAKSQPVYQSPMPRHTPRHVAPVASLEVHAPKPTPSPLLGTAPVESATPPPSAPAAPAAPMTPPAPVASEPPAAGATPAPTAPAQSEPSLLAWAYAPTVPPVSPFTHQTLHGYYPAGWMGPAPAQNGATPAILPGSASLRLVRAQPGLRLPRDIPNRAALGALVAALLSFFLPWVIVGGQRATPLGVGWPVALPLVVLVGVGLTVLLPERALYWRWFLALPLMLGCFFLGSALLLFLLSSAIAGNTVGASFLGVDVGFVVFAVASLVLTWAGYAKLVRELPLVLSGRLLLAPLPRWLRALEEKPAAAAQPPVAPPVPAVVQVAIMGPVAPGTPANAGANGNSGATGIGNQADIMPG